MFSNTYQKCDKSCTFYLDKALLEFEVNDTCMFQNECKWWLYWQRLSTSSKSKLILNSYDSLARCYFKWWGRREVGCPSFPWYSFLHILRIWIYKLCLSHTFCFFFFNLQQSILGTWYQHRLQKRAKPGWEWCPCPQQHCDLVSKFHCL